MLIEPSFKVPTTATATIQPVNLFGAEQVAISSPDGNAEAGPYLQPGSSFAHAASSDELGDLFAAATPLLDKIDTTNLSAVLGELAQASQGEGPKIAASISAGTQLAGLLDRTVDAQILALQSFARFTQAVAPAAGDLNDLNAQINAGLPSFNAEETDYENLLNTLIPFSNRLAALLSTYHPDIATILNRATTCPVSCWRSRTHIGQVVNGAYHYFQKIAEGASGLNKLPDGSTYAYFNTFILFGDVNSLVCNLIAPPTGGMSFLQPIQQALAGSGSAFNCSSELATFDALQGGSTPRRLDAGAGRLHHVRRRPARPAAAANQAYGIDRAAGPVHPGHPRRHHQPASGGLVVRLLRHFPKSAFKFALFALVCLVLLAGLAVKIGNISLFGSRHTIDAQLSDVTGLASGDAVNIAGVPVGQVSSIGGAARARPHLHERQQHGDTPPQHRRRHALAQRDRPEGDRAVSRVAAGRSSRPGATIPLDHDVTDASIDAFLNSLGPVLSSINPKEANAFVENVSGALEGDTAQINQLINSGAAVSSTVEALDSQVGQIIGNLDQVLTALASRSGDIDSLVTNLQTVSSALASKNSLLDDVVGNLSLVATDLAGLIGNNHNTITSTIDNLQAVAADVQNNQQNLANSLSSLGAGLAPYIEISQWGQWFAVETVYTCLAGQTVCPYYQPGNPPAGSGPFGSPPLPAPALGCHDARAAELVFVSPSSSALGRVGRSPLASSSLGLDLQAVSGATSGARK